MKRELREICERVGMDKPLKLLKHAEARWISLRKLQQRALVIDPVLLQHASELVSRKFKDAKMTESVQSFFKKVTDLRNSLSLAILLPMMQELETMVKVLQRRGVYLPDISDAIQTSCVQHQRSLHRQQCIQGLPDSEV